MSQKIIFYVTKNNLCHFILENCKILCHHKIIFYVTKNKLCHFILENSKIL